jgi:hypothetical protein
VYLLMPNALLPSHGARKSGLSPGVYACSSLPAAPA